MSLLLSLINHDFAVVVLCLKGQELFHLLDWACLLDDCLWSECVNHTDHDGGSKHQNTKVVYLPLNGHVEAGHSNWFDLVLLNTGHRVEEKGCEQDSDSKVSSSQNPPQL